MAFPTSPVDGQQYTTALGTKYIFSLSRGAWLIESTELVDQNVDGGCATSIYTPPQRIDGGDANG